MSRYRSQDSPQTDVSSRTPHPSLSRSGGAISGDDRDRRHAAKDASDPFVRALNLNVGDTRERVYLGDRAYDRNASEIRTLATIAAFRVVDARDLDSASPNARSGDLARLRELKLIDVTHPVFRDGERAALVTLTAEAKALLEHHRASPDGHAVQAFYAGLAKPREVQHYAQLYGAYKDAATHTAGARRPHPSRHLGRRAETRLSAVPTAHNRGRRESSGRPNRSLEEIAAWAAEHHLPIEDGHVRFPDVRIEYEHPDGRLDREDLELTTDHYNSRQMSGKRASGFRLVRGASSTRRGGKPSEVGSAREVLRMTFEQRVHAVSGFGFTPRQSAFLTTVMLHSGVCLVRHYTQFADIALGHNTRDFFLRLTRDRFATADRCWRRDGTFFHVHHKGLYRAIGEPDNQNRRRVTIPRAAERLMHLDIVLGHREVTWLATEREKVDYFVHQRQIDTADLPSVVFGDTGKQTIRYFTEKLPIGLGTRHEEIVFAYLVTQPQTDAFARFLGSHGRFFRRLRCWTILLVFPRIFATCQHRYEAEAHQLFAPALRPSTVEEFRWYCHARRVIDTSPVAPTGLDRERYAKAKQAFGGRRFFETYRRWQKDGDASLHALLTRCYARPGAAGTCELSVRFCPTVTSILPARSAPRSHPRSVGPAVYGCRNATGAFSRDTR
jgi:hypothetical protein